MNIIIWEKLWFKFNIRENSLEPFGLSSTWASISFHLTTVGYRIKWKVVFIDLLPFRALRKNVAFLCKNVF